MKEITKHSGKRSIGLPGIIFFFHDGKGSWGHVLDQNGPLWPTWNTPKKCFLLRKRPKEDERVAQGHFLTVILSYWELFYLFSFRNYGRLKKNKLASSKMRYLKADKLKSCKAIKLPSCRADMLT